MPGSEEGGQFRGYEVIGKGGDRPGLTGDSGERIKRYIWALLWK